MLAFNKKFIRLQLTFDLLLIALIFTVSAIFAQSLYTLVHKYLFYIDLPILLFVWYFSAKLNGIYDNITVSSFFRFFSIIKNIAILAFSEIIIIFFSKELLFTRSFVLLYTALLVFVLPIKSLLISKYFKTRKRAQLNSTNLIIVGTGETGRDFFNRFNSYSNLDYKITGFVDVNKNNVDSSLYLGTPDDLENIITTYKIDDVVLALDISELNYYSKVIRTCNNAAVRIHLLPDHFQFMTKNFSLNVFDDFALITMRTVMLDQFHWKFLKRSFDFLFSLLFMIFIGSWLFTIIAIIQKLTSKGPVFYIQDRVGQKNKLFKCFKFRTMTVDPNRELSFNPTLKNEQHITALGKFLRKTNIDELPQFINVFIGNMSVVGPRPHAVQFDKKYAGFVEEIKLRHIVKPGISGWAQIHGLRGDSLDEAENRLNTKERISHDIWYIENWSFNLDMQIIFVTIFQILSGKAKGQ